MCPRSGLPSLLLCDKRGLLLTSKLSLAFPGGKSFPLLNLPPFEAKNREPLGPRGTAGASKPCLADCIHG